MKILKAIVCIAALSVVMIYGCRWFYVDSPADAAAHSEDVNADEQSTADVTDALVTLPDEPVSDKEISIEKESELHAITFSFIGDCILSSNAGDNRPNTFMQTAEEQPASYFFSQAVPYYSESDFVMANCEFVLSDRNLAKASKTGTAFWFKSPTSFTDILKEGQIDLVTIANNHTGDYGLEGYKDTQQALTDAGIAWGDLQNTIYTKKGGIKFAIICTGMFNVNFDPLITPVIEEAKENSDVQILYFHGGTEKEHIPEEWLTELCHKYADMGVDLIVGSHPHVLRPMEEYNGVDIIYSLGNFCYGANRMPENRTVILTETFYFNELGEYVDQDEHFDPFYVHTGTINNWQPAPITDPHKISQTLAFMYGASDLPYIPE